MIQNPYCGMCSHFRTARAGDRTAEKCPTCGREVSQ